MKILKFVSIFFLLIVMMACTERDPVFLDTNGEAIQLSKLKGNWVIVNYWASWCPSCVKEIPELNRFYRHKNKNIILLGVSYERFSQDELKVQVKKARIEFPVLTQNPADAWHFGTLGVIPATFIIDPQGKVGKIILGETTEEKLFAEMQLLQENLPKEKLNEKK